MSEPQHNTHERVTVITLQAPPSAEPGALLAGQLLSAMARLQADPALAAAVIAPGSGPLFALRTRAERAALREAFDAIETCTKPVVCALPETCAGETLELALACHARVAGADCRLALPAVRAGLLPGLGGTQRLPRLIGLAPALELLLSGEGVPAARFAGALCDELVTGDTLAAALALARRLADAGAPPRRTGDLAVAATDRKSVV